MKYLILRTNCSLFDIDIIKEFEKNKVFDTREGIDKWFIENNLEESDYSILAFDESIFNLETILNQFNSKR